MLKSPVIVVLHVLMRGPSCRKHGVASIGICIGSAEKAKVLYGGRYDMLPYDYQEPDAFSVVPPKVTRSALHPGDQVRALYKLLLTWEKKYTLYLACANAGKTAAAINRYLEFEDLPPLYCRWKVVDIDSYARGLYRLGCDAELTPAKVLPATDLPDEWAQHHYRAHQMHLTLAKKGGALE